MRLAISRFTFFRYFRDCVVTIENVDVEPDAMTYQTQRRTAQKRRESGCCKSIAEFKQTPATQKNPKTERVRKFRQPENMPCRGVAGAGKDEKFGSGKVERGENSIWFGTRRKINHESRPPMNYCLSSFHISPPVLQLDS